MRKAVDERNVRESFHGYSPISGKLRFSAENGRGKKRFCDRGIEGGRLRLRRLQMHNGNILDILGRGTKSPSPIPSIRSMSTPM